MERIRIDASKSYEVIIGEGLLSGLGEFFSPLAKGRNVALIADDVTSRLFGAQAKASLEKEGFTVFEFSFPNGEDSKNANTYVEILEFLAGAGLTRADAIVALGGGVVGDMSGFAGASYLRGINFVQVPTTLLSAVDSSVGGKTAINLSAGKNLAGAFYQPSLVLCDTDIIADLPEKIFSDGMAEVIKYGALGSEKVLDLCRAGAKENLRELIGLCVSMKRDIVMKDERDTGERQLLNFGHTPGHAIEKLSGFEISHGSAVAIGMVMMAKSAEATGLCEKGVADELTFLCEKYSLPVKCPFGIPEMADAAMSDKKRGAGKITLVLPEKRGKCSLFKVQDSEVGRYFGAGTEELV